MKSQSSYDLHTHARTYIYYISIDFAYRSLCLYILCIVIGTVLVRDPLGTPRARLTIKFAEGATPPFPLNSTFSRESALFSSEILPLQLHAVSAGLAALRRVASSRVPDFKISHSEILSGNSRTRQTLVISPRRLRLTKLSLVSNSSSYRYIYYIIL